jgi:hypothetical protein
VVLVLPEVALLVLVVARLIVHDRRLPFKREKMQGIDTVREEAGVQKKLGESIYGI